MLSSAGTDANVCLHLFGSKGKSLFNYLGGPVPDDGDDSVERAGTDYWMMRFSSIGGALKTVCLWIDDAGDDAAVEWVEVGGKRYQFDSNGSASGGDPVWLDATFNDPY